MKNNQEFPDNNSDIRSTYTNLENVLTTSQLPINTNIPTLALAPDIREMGVRDRITYVIDSAHKAGFTLLTNVFINQLFNFHRF